MVIDTKNKLDLKRQVITKINLLLYTYMNQFDVQSIHLNYKVEGIHYFKTIPHYGSPGYNNDLHTQRGILLLKILECLKEKNFYGMCKLQNGQLVKVIPKKNA